MQNDQNERKSSHVLLHLFVKEQVSVALKSTTLLRTKSSLICQKEGSPTAYFEGNYLLETYSRYDMIAEIHVNTRGSTQSPKKKPFKYANVFWTTSVAVVGCGEN